LRWLATDRYKQQMERTARPWAARPWTSEIGGYHEPAIRLSCPGREFVNKLADGTGRAHKLAIRSTPEIRYGSNGVRNHTCLEVPLRHLLSSPEQVPSNRRQESMAQRW